jgi:hypothetical protein
MAMNVERIEILKVLHLYFTDQMPFGGVLKFVKEKTCSCRQIVGDYRMQFYSNTLGLEQQFWMKGSSGIFSADSRGS